jgi:hypothetical protein
MKSKPRTNSLMKHTELEGLKMALLSRRRQQNILEARMDLPIPRFRMITPPAEEAVPVSTEQISFNALNNLITPSVSLEEPYSSQLPSHSAIVPTNSVSTSNARTNTVSQNRSRTPSLKTKRVAGGRLHDGTDKIKKAFSQLFRSPGEQAMWIRSLDAAQFARLKAAIDRVEAKQKEQISVQSNIHNRAKPTVPSLPTSTPFKEIQFTHRPVFAKYFQALVMDSSKTSVNINEPS